MSWLGLGMFRRWHQKLPEAKGPYLPGCMDVLLGYTEHGLLLRLYYPTDTKKGDPTNKTRWYPWMPEDSYLLGLARVLMSFPFILRIAFWWCATNIPVLYGSKIRSTKEKFKCVVVSHGLGGHRWLYSNTCCELASRGFLVAAVEHRDNSACHTFYYKSKTDAENGTFTSIDYETVPFGKNHFTRRHQQVQKRAQECIKTLDFLSDLESGKVPCNVLEFTKTYREIDFSLSDLVGRLDTDNVTIMGHSFGGATALLALHQKPQFKQGILLDPWMFPIKDLALYQKVQTPLIFINTQTFHIAANVKAMSQYMEANKNNDQRQMYTILHTTHESQTDTPFLVGFWLNWFMKKLDIGTALDINNGLILRFLDSWVGCPSSLEDHEQNLEDQKHNIESGLTKAWA